MTSRLMSRVDRLDGPGRVRPMVVSRRKGESDGSFWARVDAGSPCMVIDVVPCESTAEWLERYAPKDRQ